MCGAFIKFPVRKAVGRFARANEGNVAVIFTIALVPLISFIGAAIDYSRANNARSTMQAALDSTALMLSKDLSSGVITPAQIATQAQADFNALYTNPDAQAVKARPLRPGFSWGGSKPGTIVVFAFGASGGSWKIVVRCTRSFDLTAIPPGGCKRCLILWKLRPPNLAPGGLPDRKLA